MYRITTGFGDTNNGDVIEVDGNGVGDGASSVFGAFTIPAFSLREFCGCDSGRTLDGPMEEYEFDLSQIGNE